MARSIILSNGELAVALDGNGLVRDLYYPHVGYENHVSGHYVHRVGVWVEGKMSWLADPGWDIQIECEEDALSSRILARNQFLDVQLTFKDIVYNEKPVFVRRVTVQNTSDRPREIKLYFSHQFEIYKSPGSDTAFFEPMTHALVHYKGQRVFLITATIEGTDFQDYATGLADFQGHEGSHKDADDGVLSKNPIEHGPADSILGLYAQYDPGESKIAYYTLHAAHSIAEAQVLYAYVKQKSAQHILRTASDYWRAWSSAYEWKFYKLSDEQVSLFKKSLFFVRAHVDNEGGILASIDSDMLQHGLDTYSYVWMRDASYSAMALDAAGDGNVAKHFFEFCQSTVTNDGYFLHKYLPDGSFGSSWHPWILNDTYQLPIQEDETALVLIALERHYRHSRDLEFLERVFSSLVDRMADFMVNYRDPKTGLPNASYDLWEEKRGTSTYTASAVYGALMAAASIAKTLGKQHHETRWRDAASSVASATMSILWDEKRGVFYKMVHLEGEKVAYDQTIDISSAYGVFAFGVLPADDSRLVRAFENTVRVLSEGVEAGGFPRYEGDQYYRNRFGDIAPAVSNTGASGHGIAGNPWIVTTLWYAEYLIARAKTDADLDAVRKIFDWVVKHALRSGVIPEQLDAKTGEPLSAMPLAWSHSGYVQAVIMYLNRLEELGICVGCNPVP